MNIKSNNKPIVTIITMTLNSERFLLKTLDSVAEQDYQNIEYIVIDGGSSDKTINIIQGHKKVHPLILSKPDNGTSDALNRGIAIASGEYVWALNSDDSFANSSTVSRLVSHLEANLLCDFVFGNMIMINEEGKKIGHRRFHNQYGFVDLLWDRRHLPFAGCLLRKSSLERIGGGFDEKLAYCNDLDFLLRLSFFGRMDYIHEDTGVFRLHSRSSTSSNIRKTGQETFSIRLKYVELLNNDILNAGRENEIKALLYMHAASVSFHSGNSSEVRSHLIDAVKTNFFSLVAIKPWIFLILSIFGSRIMATVATTIRRFTYTKFWYWLSNKLSSSGVYQDKH